jgi:hypothetical protein
MPPTPPRADRADPRADRGATDYEQLRNHLGRPRLEHPIARQRHAVVAAPVAPHVSPRVSVMEWLSAIGRAAARRMRGAPSSALARLYRRK